MTREPACRDEANDRVRERRRDPVGLSPEQRRQLAFLLILMGYGLILAITTPSLSPGARAFPLLVLAAAAVLWAIKLIATLVRGPLRDLIEPRGILPRADAPTDTVRKGLQEIGTAAPSAWLLWGWTLGTLAVMYAFGFLIGTGLAIILYVKGVCRASWIVAAASAAVTVAFVHLVFGELLRLDLGPVALTTLLQP